ncbi:MAG: hypothetical protein QOF20_905 [Acidimicrobiaceae bacterium]|nr:hypothetical protein [Acidimicrobiaceae bacterium]
MNAASVSWYWRRLRQMTTREVVWRVTDQARHQAWRRRQVRPGQVPPDPVHLGQVPPGLVPAAPPRLPPGLAATVPAGAARALRMAADEILDGRWTVLGVARPDIARPDWFLDPLSGRHAPGDRYAFAVNTRSEEETGNIKQVWEMSRHHHLTVVAAAWWLTGDDRYAEMVGEQLRSWWDANPFLSGVHWTSGIELGIRLIAWTWIRRLLDGWPGAEDLFDRNPVFHRQLHWHQEYLDHFVSRGSSANNHVVAEAAGQLTASCAFPWFAESDRWRRASAVLLEDQLERNTFPSGVNRELASEYHCLVAELGLVAAVEAAASGHPLGLETGVRLRRMVDAAAALVDVRLGGPRQGDGDDGHTLVVDGPETDRWASLLTLGAAVMSPLPWWPTPPGADVRSTVLAGLLRSAPGAAPAGNAPGAPGEGVAAVDGRPARALMGSALEAPTGRPDQRPWHFPDAGITILRTTVGAPGDQPEIWCRCDGGPHGYLTIAAHGHADALAIEVRHGGTEVFADPGTYCYQGEAKWRSYFRSTLAHNTIELGGRDQSISGGPFLWVETAETEELAAAPGRWSAEHDGYRSLTPPAVHRRTVELDAASRQLTVTDRVVCDRRHRARMAWHLGPSVDAEFPADGPLRLCWPGGSATVELPGVLRWSLHRGETDPIAGWYSQSFGQKQPAVTLIGTGVLGSADGEVVTVVSFSG